MFISIVTFSALWLATYGSPPPNGCTDVVNGASWISGAISACSGVIGSGGTYGADAEALCGSGYHVCKSAVEVGDFGLTEAMCDNLPNDGEYFGTQETSDGWGQCYSYRFGDPNSQNFNDIWGCAKGGGHTNAYQCGALGWWLGQGKSWSDGWYLPQDNVDGKDYSLMEAKAYQLRNADYSKGGVLCCADDDCSAAGESLSLGHRCQCQDECDARGQFCRSISDVQSKIGGTGGVCASGICCCSCSDCVPFGGYLN